MRHQVTRAYPISPVELLKIISFLSALGADAEVYVIALLLAYLTLVHQSNLVSLSPDKVGPHTLLFKHVHCLSSSLLVSFTSTKTCSHVQPPLLFFLPALPHSPYCPVSAWIRYASSCTFCPDDLALRLSEGTFLTASLLSQVLNLAASVSQSSTPCLTLYGLRRDAVQACLWQECHSLTYKKRVPGHPRL